MAGEVEEPKEPGINERAVSSDGSENEERADTRPELTVLVLLRDQLQKLRIAEGNRAAASLKLEEQSRADLHLGYANRLQDLEDEITNAVKVEMRLHPAWPWMSQLRGVAETSAALVVGYIDIRRCNTVSALWRFSGYGVIQSPCTTCEGEGYLDPEHKLVCGTCHGAGNQGKRERPVKGERLHYNARLKTMVYRFVDLQVKTRGSYRVTYENAKATYITTRPDWTLGHVELAARRKVAKLFLSHLWQVWREAEGLPVRGPFIEGVPGHDIIDPWSMVDPVKAEKAKAKSA